MSVSLSTQTHHHHGAHGPRAASSQAAGTDPATTPSSASPSAASDPTASDPTASTLDDAGPASAVSNFLSVLSQMQTGGTADDGPSVTGQPQGAPPPPAAGSTPSDAADTQAGGTSTSSTDAAAKLHQLLTALQAYAASSAAG